MTIIARHLNIFPIYRSGRQKKPDAPRSKMEIEMKFQDTCQYFFCSFSREVPTARVEDENNTFWRPIIIGCIYFYREPQKGLIIIDEWTLRIFHVEKSFIQGRTFSVKKKPVITCSCWWTIMVLK